MSDEGKIANDAPGEILKPADIEEGGVTIPVPTPTGAVPNPWLPNPNGSGPPPASDQPTSKD